MSLILSKNIISRLHNILKIRPQKGFHTSTICPQKWDLMSGVCVERYPSLSSPFSDIEETFAEIYSKKEYEKSYLNNFELQTIDDEAFLRKIQSSDYEPSEEDESRVTNNELLDRWHAELQDFSLASRITEADEKNDTKSLERKLDRKLTLTVKQKLGDKEHWMLPQGKREEGESMRQAAERTLKSLCGDNIKAKFIGNSPCGYINYMYPRQGKSEDQPVGAKVFYFKAHLQDGQVSEGHSNDIKDFQWLSKEELLEQLDRRVAAEAKKFILDL